MKRSIILSALFFPALLWGQKINHFENLDSKWNVAKTYTAANQQNPNFVATTTTVYGFQGDSLFNGKQWFKLYSTNDPLFQHNFIFHGLTRVENRRVLYLNTSNQLDTLYDFNLNVGDSVLFDLNGVYPEWLQVLNADSIQLSGNYYKRLKFAEPLMNAFDELSEIWIEGIGSIHGPLFPTHPVKFSQERPDSMVLTCTYTDNQQIWQHPAYSNCYINIVLGLDTKESLDFKAYPNPFHDKITFESNNTGKFDLKVLNSLGQIVRQMGTTSNHETIDLSGLNDGMYYLRISDQKSTRTIKIIKKQKPY